MTVSMVIPCHNKVKYIANTLRSVCGQTWNDIELILVNDGAADGTREVIAQWVPRLEQRGYRVVVIDQENAGINGAVLAGMRRMTGELFCCIDCDDELHPEYISAMAVFLRDGPAYDWVACDYLLMMDCVDDRRTFKDETYPLPLDGADLPLAYLAYFTNPNTWVYMVRTSYLRRCRVIENFITRPRAVQEPLLIIPLAAGGGRLGYINRPLYYFNQCSRNSFGRDHQARIPDLGKNILCLQRKMVALLPEDNPKKARCAGYLELRGERWIFPPGTEETRAAAARMTEAVNRQFSPAPRVSQETVLRSGPRILLHAAHNIMLGRQNPYLTEDGAVLAAGLAASPGKRTAYGALGLAAGELVHALMGTPLRPDALWDIAAQPGDSRSGLTVSVPDFENLKKDDIMLVAAKYYVVQNYVACKLHALPGTVCLGHLELLDYLAAWYYADMQRVCRYTVAGAHPPHRIRESEGIG